MGFAISRMLFREEEQLRVPRDARDRVARFCGAEEDIAAVALVDLLRIGADEPVLAEYIASQPRGLTLYVGGVDAGPEQWRALGRALAQLQRLEFLRVRTAGASANADAMVFAWVTDRLSSEGEGVVREN